jgi:hypothetical protein
MISNGGASGRGQIYSLVSCANLNTMSSMALINFFKEILNLPLEKLKAQYFLKLKELLIKKKFRL